MGTGMITRDNSQNAEALVGRFLPHPLPLSLLTRASIYVHGTYMPLPPLVHSQQQTR